jgi:UDP-N-acetylglucosamine acyltransferase
VCAETPASSPTSVHPSAEVSSRAVLGDGVSVGPFAIVEAGAVLGAGTTVKGHAVICGHATLGTACVVHYGAVVGDDPQDISFSGGDTRVTIGAGTIIREHATVHRATRDGDATRIGDACYLMGSSHVAHDCVLGDRVIVCNSALIAGHARIGDRAFLSGNTVVHQFARVGRVVMLSGTGGIGRDVGPFLTVTGRSEIAGLNVVGMRRAGIDHAGRNRVREAYRLLFAAHSLEEGLVEVRALGEEYPEIAAICEFYATTTRGFSRPPPDHKIADHL